MTRYLSPNDNSDVLQYWRLSDFFPSEVSSVTSIWVRPICTTFSLDKVSADRMFIICLWTGWTMKRLSIQSPWRGHLSFQRFNSPWSFKFSCPICAVLTFPVPEVNSFQIVVVSVDRSIFLCGDFIFCLESSTEADSSVLTKFNLFRRHNTVQQNTVDAIVLSTA